MNNRYVKALLSSTLSIIPIIAIIFLLSLSNVAPIGNNFAVQNLGTDNYLLLGIGAIIMIVGLAAFQIGARTGLTKVGEYMGSSLSKQRHLFIVIIFSFLLGMLITCAEPSILIVANQINVNKWVLIGSIGAGVGIFVVVGILRIVFHRSLTLWYLIFYLLVFMFICLLMVDGNNHAFLPFIFDAGGVTTGSATVPFILAMGAGVATVRGGHKSRDSSFGLVGLASVGPIIMMTILILLSPTGFSAYKVPVDGDLGIWARLVNSLIPSSGLASLGTIIEVLMAFLPIVIIFFVYNFLYLKLPARKIGQVMIGFGISFVGLVLFLTAVAAAMSPIGLKVGYALSAQPYWLIIFLAFILGMVTILCEPAVHVLTTQIENFTEGEVKKQTVLLTLSIGVGAAICLSVARTLFNFSIMYYIVPGYAISLILMFVVPDIYTAIAFDSGGTASGPMAVSFILPLIIGLYSALGTPMPGDVTAEIVPGKIVITESVSFYSSAFGVVAMIALTPILAIQVLGVVSVIKREMRLKEVREQIMDARNDEIIHFA